MPIIVPVVGGAILISTGIALFWTVFVYLPRSNESTLLLPLVSLDADVVDAEFVVIDEGKTQ